MSQVTMPKMGEAMEEGTLLRWLKKEGDPVAENEPIAEVETDKAAMEVPSYVSGTITRLLIQEGDTVSVGAPIALIGDGADGDRPEDGVDTVSGQVPESEGPPQVGATAVAAGDAPVDGGDTVAAPAPSTEEDETIATPESDAAAGSPADRVFSSPLARKIAADAGVDLRAIRGSGPNHRIVEADVREYLQRVPHAPDAAAATTAPSESPASPARPAPSTPETKPVTPTSTKLTAPSVAGEDRPVSRMRQTIARRLLESKITIPHYYVTSEIDMKAAMELHAHLKAVEMEGRPRPTLTDMIVKACAIALIRFPGVQAQWAGETIRIPAGVHIGNAVSVPDGLIVPVVHDCDRKTLHQIAAETRPLYEKAREGKLGPDHYSGGTFTISNMGMFDVENFAAIINPPQSAILAVSSIRETVVAMEGEAVIRPRMKVTLSADHRVVDGVLAAQFLQELKRIIQAPYTLVE